MKNEEMTREIGRQLTKSFYGINKTRVSSMYGSFDRSSCYPVTLIEEFIEENINKEAKS